VKSRHIVRRAAEADFAAPAASLFAASKGYARWSVVDESDAVHTGFATCRLAPGGQIQSHVHSFEESFYVLGGSAVVTSPEGSFRVREGDYGLLPTGVPHTWRNEWDAEVSWAEMQAPQPRSRFNEDTFVVPELDLRTPLAVDVRDPRTRSYGHIDPVNMDPRAQTQDRLAVTASMRTALLLYSGVSVKMMVDSDLGAVLSSMFMVQYEPKGIAGPHDHPFEETYMILEGSVEASFDGTPYHMEAGDIAWAGAGCAHSFSNPANVPVRWLETQAPAPPGRHSYRFARDWDYLRAALDANDPT